MRFLAVVFFVTMFGVMAEAATLPDLNPDDKNYQDRKQLGVILLDVEKAINSANLKAMERHMHPRIVVAWYNAEISYGIPEVEEYYNRMLKASNRLLNSFSTRATVSRPAVIHGNFAVASGSTQDHLELVGGDTLDIPGIWTASLIKENGDWKITSIHFSTNTFDNPVSGQLGNTIWIAAAIGFLTGLLLMWMVTRRK